MLAALDSCAPVIILMRFTERGTKCGGCGDRIWGRPHDTERKKANDDSFLYKYPPVQ